MIDSQVYENIYIYKYFFSLSRRHQLIKDNFNLQILLDMLARGQELK